MGKKGDAAKTSLALAFLAAGGAVAGQASAAPAPDGNVEAVVSSYFGGLGLRDDFEAYLKLNTGFETFLKYWKETPGDSTCCVIKFVINFSNEHKIPPPPGFESVGTD